MKYSLLSIFILLSNLCAFAQKTTVYCNDKLELIELGDLMYPVDSIVAEYESLDSEIFTTIETLAIFERNDTAFHVVKPGMGGRFIEKLFGTATFPELGDKLIPFELTTLGGALITSKVLEGKIVFLNFWTTTCGPCIADIPALEQLRRDYEKRGVVFLAIGTSSKEETKAILANHDWRYQQIGDASDYTQQYTIGYPLNLLIDQEEKIIMKAGSFSALTSKENETLVYEENTQLVRLLLDQLLTN